jgi:hypothetical protein
MKKIFYFLLTLLVLSCSSDDIAIDEPIQTPTFQVDLLLKRWEFNKITFNGNTFDYMHQPNCMKDEFTFANQQGQIRQYNELVFVNNNCSTNSLYLDWRIKNDTISFYFGSVFITNFKVISLSDTKLVYSFYKDVDRDARPDLIIMEAIPYQ